MLSVQDYEKLSAEAFEITKIQRFKHEPFLSVGGGGGLMCKYLGKKPTIC